MKTVAELRARAALCQQLAVREPTNRDIWLAEAERWSHLAKDNRFEASACKSTDDKAISVSALMEGFFPAQSKGVSYGRPIEL